jgi:hypothetical protein
LKWRSDVRAEALAAPTNHLEGAQQAAVYGEALAATHAIGDAPWRTKALATPPTLRCMRKRARRRRSQRTPACSCRRDARAPRGCLHAYAGTTPALPGDACASTPALPGDACALNAGETPALPGDACALMRARRPRSQGMPDMVFIEIIRYSPRRRASPWIAEGFSPTARGAYRIYSSSHRG